MIIHAMRDLSTQHQLTIRSDPGPVLALDEMVARLRAAGVRFKGRKISKEGVVNAAFLMLADFPTGDLVNRIGPYVARLEALLSEDDDQAGPGAELGGGDAASFDPGPEAMRPRKKKGG